MCVYAYNSHVNFIIKVIICDIMIIFLNKKFINKIEIFIQYNFVILTKFVDIDLFIFLEYFK